MGIKLLPSWGVYLFETRPAVQVGPFLLDSQVVHDVATALFGEKTEEPPIDEKDYFVCPYCGYRCPNEELGGEWDCPRCGDN